MVNHLLTLLRAYLTQYGYLAVAIALLLENAGIPVPGETVLLLASFLAYSERQLLLSRIILVAICAAILGDNLGYLVGYYGGRPLIERYEKIFWIKPQTMARAERLFERHGSLTIFVARFIAGLRIIAGPLAGVLRMNWPRFLLFNSLGAVLWVTVISIVGYLFGEHWDQLIHFLHRFNLVVFLIAICVVAIWWWRRHRSAS